MARTLNVLLSRNNVPVQIARLADKQGGIEQACGVISLFRLYGA